MLALLVPGVLRDEDSGLPTLVDPTVKKPYKYLIFGEYFIFLC